MLSVDRRPVAATRLAFAPLIVSSHSDHAQSLADINGPIARSGQPMRKLFPHVTHFVCMGAAVIAPQQENSHDEDHSQDHDCAHLSQFR